MKKTGIIILSLAVVSLSAGTVLRLNHEGTIDERAVLKDMEAGTSFSPKQGIPLHYRSERGSVAFNSYDIVPGIRGYAGPLKVMVLLDEKGRIADIRLLEHRETKNYVHYMESPAYLSRFIGKHAADRFRVNEDVDAITRATVSVEALAKTVRESSRSVASGVLGLRIPDADRKERSSRAWMWYPVLFSLSLTGYYSSRRRTAPAGVRDLSLALGIAVIGFILSSPFSVLHVFNLLLGRPSSAALWYAVVITTFLSVIVAGRFYCGWLCPFGALSEFIGRLPFRKWTVPSRLDRASRNLKYILFGLAATVVLLTGKPDYGNYETALTLFSFHGNALSWSLVTIALVANIRISRFWCRCLCPVAALTGLLCRTAEGYAGGPDCPMGNRSGAEPSECIRCNRCYERAMTEVRNR